MNDNKQLRKCSALINGYKKKALFHCWSFNSKVVEPSLMIGGHPGGTVAYTTGIVELEDGKVVNLFPEHIKFTDDMFKKHYRKMNRKEKIEKINEHCSKFTTEECINNKCKLKEVCNGAGFDNYSEYRLDRMIYQIEIIEEGGN